MSIRRHSLRAFVAIIGLAGVLAVSGCAPTTQRLGPLTAMPRIDGMSFVMPDGAVLPFREWGDPVEPRAIIIALHGFNDYSKSFEMPGEWWATKGFLTIAYDQRGFGSAPRPGIFPAKGVLVEDLETVVALVRAAHPGVPTYLVGESMGSAVAMLAVRGGAPIDGVVLGAPAIWGWSTMNPFYKIVLSVMAHIVPRDHVTGAGLGVVACDNRDVLIAMGRDPLVIKETRIDAVYALVSLMDRAYKTGPMLTGRTLILYGDHDQVVPASAMNSLKKKLPSTVQFDLVANGYHMLFRDLNAETVWRDVEQWIEKPGEVTAR
jgi:acylglycerol lipase